VTPRSIGFVPGPELSGTSKKPLLIFDGDCAFCTTWVNRLVRWLPRFPEAQPWQWLELESYGLTVDDVTRYAWYITPRRQFAGHLAFSALLRAQPRFGLRFAGWMLATPPFSWAASAGYAVIARYRHRLPGGTPACALPRPD
jgi:predicted DCC family thiol-disulfide oxidoreductase YuxK